ncbi:MAG: hypothetical protein WCO57_11885 [Verrucomicrobiota bacterium]
MLVMDAHGGNMVKTSSGIVPIDIVTHRPHPSEIEAIKKLAKLP